MAKQATNMVPSIPCGHCVNGLLVEDGGRCTRCGGKGFNLTDANADLADAILATIAGVKPAVKVVPADMSNAEKVAARKVARQAATAARRAASGKPVTAWVGAEAVGPAPVAPVAPVDAAPAGKLPRAERKARNRALWAELNGLVAAGEITRAQHAERWAARGF